MSCTYYLKTDKGEVAMDEYKLNDYLQNVYTKYPTLGDAVFSKMTVTSPDPEKAVRVKENFKKNILDKYSRGSSVTSERISSKDDKEERYLGSTEDESEESGLISSHRYSHTKGVSELMADGNTFMHGEEAVVDRFDIEQRLRDLDEAMKNGTLYDPATSSNEPPIIDIVKLVHGDDVVVALNKCKGDGSFAKKCRESVLKTYQYQMYFRTSYGNLTHAVAQEVAWFLENKRSIKRSDIGMIVNLVKNSDPYKQALFVKDSNNSHIDNKFLPTDHMDVLIKSLVNHNLQTMRNLGILDLSADEYKMKEGMDIYAEVRIFGQSDIPDPNDMYHRPYDVKGFIDMVTIDANGKVKIYDYKTSKFTNYGEYESAAAKKKRHQNALQLAVYRRLLANNMNIREEDIDCEIVGYTLENYHPINTGSDETVQWAVDDIVPFSGGFSHKFEYETDNSLSAIIESVNRTIPKRQPKLEYKDDLVKFEADFKLQIFGETKKKYTEKDALNLLTEVGFSQTKTGKLTCTLYGKNYIASDIDELTSKVMQVMNEMQVFSEEHTRNIRAEIADCLEKGGTLDTNINNTKTRGKNKSYYHDLINHYLNGSYRLLDVDDKIQNTFDKLGYIVFENKTTNALEVVCLTAEYPLLAYRNNNGSYITNKNTYLKDNVDPKLLKNTVGARNAITATVILNKIFKANPNDIHSIARITTVNQNLNDGECPSNEEIVYAMNKIQVANSGSENSNLVTVDDVKDTRLVSKLGLAKLCARELLQRFDDPIQAQRLKQASKLKDSILDFISLKEDDNFYILPNEIDVDDTIVSFIQSFFFDKMDAKPKAFKDMMSISESVEHQTLDQEFYHALLMTYAKASGYNFNQEGEYKSFDANYKNGSLTINSMETAGHFDNKTLNQISTAMVRSLSKLRMQLSSQLPTIRNAVSEYAKAKGYTKLEDDTFGFKSKLYEHLMVMDTEKGLMEFRRLDDPELDDADRKFLKIALDFFAKYRWGDNKDHSSNPAYYYVPMLRGSKYSASSVNQYANRMKQDVVNMKDNLMFMFKNSDAESGISAGQSEKENLWILDDSFRHSDINQTDAARRVEIKTRGVDYYENDIENMMIGFMFERERANNLKRIVPIIHAAYSFSKNTEYYTNQDNSKTCEFIEEYTKCNVHRESIQSKKVQAVTNVIDKMKGVLSKWCLAFSPVQLTYQNLQGFLQNTLQAIKKSSSTADFDYKDLTAAMAEVYPTALRPNDEMTVPDLLNELLGINNVNMKHYTETVSSNRNGIQHIGDRIAMKFTERPDFYNRMSLAIAQMIHEDVYKSFSIKDNELIYDFNKDGRFSLLTKGDFTSPEAMKQYALYSAMAQEFMNMGVTYKDGTPFSFSVGSKNILPLPSPFTPNQITSIKDIGDLVYGYYDDMNKGLWSQTWLGSLFMHFRTYWPAKKNQYLAAGGVKLRGSYQQKVDVIKDDSGKTKEVKYFYKKDPEGNWTAELTTNESEAFSPVYEWVGDYQEGIIATFADWIKAHSDENIMTISRLKQKREDGTITTQELNILRAKEGNMKQVYYDISMIGLGWLIAALLRGFWDDEKKGFDEKNNLSDAMVVDAYNLLDKTIKNGFADFNPISSIVAPTTDWNPIMHRMVGRHIKSIYNCITGDKDAWGVMVDLYSSSSAIGNTLNVIKPDYIKEQGGVIYPGVSFRRKNDPDYEPSQPASVGSAWSYFLPEL